MQNDLAHVIAQGAALGSGEPADEKEPSFPTQQRTKRLSKLLSLTEEVSVCCGCVPMGQTTAVTTCCTHVVTVTHRITR